MVHVGGGMMSDLSDERGAGGGGAGDRNGDRVMCESRYEI